MAQADCPLCGGTGWKTVDRAAEEEKQTRGSREKPMEGVSSRIIADHHRSIEFIDKSNSELASYLRRLLQPDDILVAMGAGDVHEVAELLVGND